MVCTHTHHCALSAARGQGQRNLEFPEAAISELEKKGRLSTFSNKRQRRILSSHFLIHGCKPSLHVHTEKKPFTYTDFALRNR